jgi:hypothetical protein
MKQYVNLFLLGLGLLLSTNLIYFLFEMVWYTD